MLIKPVKNNINLNKNIIITGPNASGKTTLIKSTILNLFFSQSIGMGCYDKCITPIFDFFHSYLNIPDTSNRDSLFQAEARRCKDIIDFIHKNKNKKHLCIFDEIYSGTNPTDAVLCASIYLDRLNEKKDNVDYILTTHYIGICNHFDKSKITINKKMKSYKKNNSVNHTYIMENGISTINGGYSVLLDLEKEKK
jgi:DNA mismatch repair ATPase MutS